MSYKIVTIDIERVTLRNLDLRLERSLRPGLVRASCVKTPAVAEFLKRLFKK